MKNVVVITFDTDREPTMDEKNAILYSLIPQVEEPTDVYGEEIELQTSGVTAKFV